jgi:hypothetical protein
MIVKAASLAFCVVASTACAPLSTVSGGAMLNVQPTSQIPIVGSYDFDLLDSVRGQACVRSAAASGKPKEYWIGMLPFMGTPPKDSLTVGAIAAASTDAIDKIAGADTLVLTRVVTEGKSPDEVCAYVYGRAVRLKKGRLSKHGDGDDDDADAHDHDDDDDESSSKRE